MRLLALSLFFLAAPAVAVELRLGTTTSVENSGLLDYLLPAFEARYEATVSVIPVGSGRALALGRQGDIDVLIVHAPDDEKRFVEAGYGLRRVPVMYNYFVLLAPPTDSDEVPAGDIFSTLNRVAREQRYFVSRGDDSGTHKKEVLLWQQLKQQTGRSFDFSDAWYIAAGIGMGQAIVMADELQAYVLSDWGTFLYFQDQVDLQLVSSRESALLNIYSVIPINPERHPHVNNQLAQSFVDWLSETPTQQQIASYRIDEQSLFFPIESLRLE